MQIDIRPIVSAEENIDFSYQLDLSNEEFYGEKPLKEAASVVGSAYNRHGVMHLEAKCTAVFSSVCGRCLKEVNEEINTNVNFILTKEATDNEDSIYIEDNFVDLDEIMKIAIILDCPSMVLCSEDCKGLCSKCGHDLNEGDCSCDKRVIDDRLAILQTLLDK